MKTIMKQAHRIARTMTGNYSARLSEALKIAWKKYRSVIEIQSAFKEVSGYCYENGLGVRNDWAGHYKGD